MLDVTAEYVSMIEHGRKAPSKKLLNKLGVLLDRGHTTSRPSGECKRCAELESELREARAVIRDQASALAAALASKPLPSVVTVPGSPDGVYKVGEKAKERKGA